MSNDLPVEDQMINALRRITRAIDLHSRLLLQRNGLTTPQLVVLQAIQRRQPANAGTIAKDVYLGPATITGILGRLEDRELISRTRSQTDRRSVMVQLTEKGAKLIADAPSLLQERFRSELAGLREWEQTMILSTLQRVAAMMDDGSVEVAPELVAGAVAVGPMDVLHYPEKMGDNHP